MLTALTALRQACCHPQIMVQRAQARQGRTDRAEKRLSMRAIMSRLVNRAYADFDQAAAAWAQVGRAAGLRGLPAGTRWDSMYPLVLFVASACGVQPAAVVLGGVQPAAGVLSGVQPARRSPVCGACFV